MKALHTLPFDVGLDAKSTIGCWFINNFKFLFWEEKTDWKSELILLTKTNWQSLNKM